MAAQEEIRSGRCRLIVYMSWKSSNCMIRQSLTWNPERLKQNGRTKNILSCESELDIKKRNRTWKQLEQSAHNKVSGRNLVSNLYFFTIFNRLKEVIYIKTYTCTSLNSPLKRAALHNTSNRLQLLVSKKKYVTSLFYNPIFIYLQMRV